MEYLNGRDFAVLDEPMVRNRELVGKIGRFAEAPVGIGRRELEGGGLGETSIDAMSVPAGRGGSEGTIPGPLSRVGGGGGARWPGESQQGPGPGDHADKRARASSSARSGLGGER